MSVLVPLATFRVPLGESYLVKGKKKKSWTATASPPALSNILWKQQCKNTTSLLITVRIHKYCWNSGNWSSSRSVDWRAVSEGKPGGVMVQSLDNQLMAPDWLKTKSLIFGAKLEKVETYAQHSQPCGILRTMLNRTWYQKLEESLKIFVANEDNYYRSVSLFQWKINFENLWRKTTNLEFQVEITNQFSLVSLFWERICAAERENFSILLH